MVGKRINGTEYWEKLVKAHEDRQTKVGEIKRNLEGLGFEVDLTVDWCSKNILCVAILDHREIVASINMDSMEIICSGVKADYEEMSETDLLGFILKNYR